MIDPERGDGGEARDTPFTPDTGEILTLGEGLIVRVQGPTRDGIRVSDSRGWTATGDIEAGTTSNVSAAGKPSQNEDLTLETCAILIRRLNADGAAWSEPVQLDSRIGGDVDCEARDRRDSRRRLTVQVTRAESDGDFWARLRYEARAELPQSTVDEGALRLWERIEDKRFHAHPNDILALNAIRTPWLALRPVVEAFRRQYAAAARDIGFQAIWIVGASEAFTERLDA